jgi:hypothetical protein
LKPVKNVWLKKLENLKKFYTISGATGDARDNKKNIKKEKPTFT